MQIAKWVFLALAFVLIIWGDQLNKTLKKEQHRISHLDEQKRSLLCLGGRFKRGKNGEETYVIADTNPKELSKKARREYNAVTRELRTLRIESSNTRSKLIAATVSSIVLLLAFAGELLIELLGFRAL